MRTVPQAPDRPPVLEYQATLANRTAEVTGRRWTAGRYIAALQNRYWDYGFGQDALWASQLAYEISLHDTGRPPKAAVSQHANGFFNGELVAIDMLDDNPTYGRISDVTDNLRFMPDTPYTENAVRQEMQARHEKIRKDYFDVWLHAAEPSRCDVERLGKRTAPRGNYEYISGFSQGFGYGIAVANAAILAYENDQFGNLLQDHGFGIAQMRTIEQAYE